MDEENNNLIIDTSSSPSSPLVLPIIEENEKLLSSMTTTVPPISSEIDEKVMTPEETSNENNAHVPNFDDDKKTSPLSQSHSPQTNISTILDTIITQIEIDNDNQLNSLPIIEDDQMEIEEDDDDDDVDEGNEDEEEGETKSNKIEREQPITKPSSSSSSSTITTTVSATTTKRDSKPITRTLRSHARGKINFSSILQSSSSNPNNNARRVSNRRRALEKKLLLAANEKEKKRRSISERMKKDQTTTDDIQTSSNSDDQINENPQVEKLTSNQTTNPNDDVSSCSSTGVGDGSSSNGSATNIKQTTSTTDIESLPPNKRRLRERNANTSNTIISPDASNNNSNTDNSSSAEPITSREIPMNSIKKFLEIRQQIDKRHETMLNEFVLPKVPKDFSETTMGKKSYLIAPSFSSFSITPPISMGIKRLSPPHDLDPHLADVFTKQEDERYKMKIRQQVERDKLNLSYEQEVLRLCGNATRSSVNQEIPFSFCSLLKDNEVYNNPSIQLPEKLITNDYTNTELGKRGKHRWNGRLFIKWLEDSNLKYKRLSCELNERQRLEVDTLYSMQRMVWSKHLPKEALSLSISGRMNYFLSERYLPKVEINPNFWTTWETSPF